ncbi:hypothetical protein [Cohnella thailandensis]|uniref:DUF3679 domain-containing protein n=1 Tax=Cohnella thailandensis TaxID=557557 RepID=A0A841SZZ8_9BACL|nr:hypothetical protein [Cohnella thailandensis]MBB6636196.1 hypothetical protein [Cohnella thailandensis]MBP1973835.1 hypothetical protein [Cohnella thailandensis]
MRKDLFKLMIVAGAILFAVLFGMELASSGIQSVYGPVDSGGSASSGGNRNEASADPVADNPRYQDSYEEEAPENARYGNEPEGISYDSEAAAQEGEAVIPRLDRPSMVDRLAGKTAEALQSASKGGIHFIVNLFNRTTE